MAVLQREAPLPQSPRDKCYFYHTMQYPDGEAIQGSWTIPDFQNYIGGYGLNGKTVLDVGTASGYLAFNAELAGADVTGLEAATTDEFRHFPFESTLSYKDIETSRRVWTATNLEPIKRAWWYGWHKYNSRAKAIYAPIADLYGSRETFDVVIAGAIVEHLSDPVYAVGAWTRVAREAVILPFTEVAEDDGMFMEPMFPLADPGLFYVWWRLSRGLWTKLFDNLGFDVQFPVAYATHNDTPIGPQPVQRPTIVATRRPGTWERLNG